MKVATKSLSHDVIQRMIPPLTVWMLGKVLDVPRVQHALKAEVIGIIGE